MQKALIFLALLLLATASGTARAAEQCQPEPVKVCEMRKHPGCGPISLNYWQSAQAVHCESASVPLSQTKMTPQLRSIECFFSGDDTQIRISGNNYQAQRGPAIGDVIAVENGTARVQIVGIYTAPTRDSRIDFENIGPGGVVVFNCLGYGPG